MATMQADVLLVVAIGLCAGCCVGLLVWMLYGRLVKAPARDAEPVADDSMRELQQTLLDAEVPSSRKLRSLLSYLGGVIDYGRRGQDLCDAYARAGWPSRLSPEQVLGIPILVGLLTMLVTFLPLLLLNPLLALLAPLLGFSLGYAGLNQWIKQKESQRLSEISRIMPYVMDLIGMAMHSGASFLMVIEQVAMQYRDHPIGEEFSLVYHGVQKGLTIESAMLIFKERLLEVPIAMNFADDVIQSQRYGQALSDTLEDSAQRYKAMRIMTAREKSGKAKVEILAPGVLILFGSLLLLFGPFLVSFLQNQGGLGVGF